MNESRIRQSLSAEFTHPAPVTVAWRHEAPSTRHTVAAAAARPTISQTFSSTPLDGDTTAGVPGRVTVCPTSVRRGVYGLRIADITSC